MDTNNYPPKYLVLNEQASKNLAIVMEIEGISDVYGVAQTFTYVRYGDAGIVYGLPGLVYGGLRNVSQVKPWLVLDSSLTIGQRIEPEQGKGNVGTITVSLIDFNGEVSAILAPVPSGETNVFGGRDVKLWLGYKQSSWPEDYVLLYRGYITQIVCPPGMVKFQISDTTTKKRQPLYTTFTTILTGSIDAVQTTIPVAATEGFYVPIMGPAGTYDPNIRVFLVIDSEIMEYDQTGIGSGTFTVIRGSLGSIAAAHDAGTSVSNSILIGDFAVGMNSIDIMLKTLLSGWDGPCETNIPIQSFVYTPVGSNTSALVLGVNANNKPINALQDLGLIVGDYITVTGASNPGNNVYTTIVDIVSSADPNDTLILNTTLVLEPTTSAVAAFRSQYDTFPVQAGLRLRMRDVDQMGILYIKNTYFSAASFANMRFYQTDANDGKDFIDSNINLPLGCYGISRFGRVSMSVTKPPLPGIGKLLQLDWTNVIDPDKIQVTRATNNRTFFNNVNFSYNQNLISGNFTNVEIFTDIGSIGTYGQQVVLPIQAPGITNDIGSSLPSSRGAALLNRYKDGALLIDLSVNWSVGSLIEVSDIVILVDNGKLQIMNFQTGQRNLGTQLFEVINRQYNIYGGNVKLTLLGGLNFDLTSRYGLFSPSTNLIAGSTTTILKITPSYGTLTIDGELAKWARFVGYPIRIRSQDWTVVETATIVDVGVSDPTGIAITNLSGSAPPAGYIIEIATYTGDSTVNLLYKTLYAAFSPSVAVTSGTSSTVFDVGAGDVGKFFVGCIVIVRNSDWSQQSSEVKVTDISGTQITVDKSLGFTPTSSNTVDGIGFVSDGTSFYRYD